MQRRGFPITGSIIFAAGVVLGLASLGADTSSPRRSPNLPEFTASAGPHVTRADPQNAFNLQNATRIPRQPEVRTGALIASNDNWQTTIIGGIITSSQLSAIQNSGYAPTAASESAIIATLQPGNYTAIVRGINNTTGVALVEVYDLSSDTISILGNISTRDFVQTGDNVMIGGFIIQGTGPKTVIVRAIGPELIQFGITNALANPTFGTAQRYWGFDCL
jgi:hypothetical protein